MKKIVVILTLGFLMAFAGTSQAWGCRYGYGYRWGYRPCYRPVVVVCHPRIWVAPYWAWDWRFHRRVWIRGYWR